MSSEDARLHTPRIFLDSKSARAGGSAYTGAIGNAADYDERKLHWKILETYVESKILSMAQPLPRPYRSHLDCSPPVE